jgi:hypothetical protein
MLVGSRQSGRLADKIGARVAIVARNLLVVAGTWWLSLVGAGSELLPAILLGMIGWHCRGHHPLRERPNRPPATTTLTKTSRPHGTDQRFWRRCPPRCRIAVHAPLRSTVFLGLAARCRRRFGRRVHPGSRAANPCLFRR